jgi:hypothetical protein
VDLATEIPIATRATVPAGDPHLVGLAEPAPDFHLIGANLYSVER